MNKKLLFVTCSLVSGAGLSACGDASPNPQGMTSQTRTPTPTIQETPEAIATKTPTPTTGESLAETIPEDEMIEMIDSLWGMGGGVDDAEDNDDAGDDREEEAEEETPTATPTISTRRAPSPSPKQTSPSPSASSTDEATPVESSVANFKDGVYQATGGYRSPAGNETINVELVIADGEIINVNVTPQARHQTSIRMQQQFADGIGLEVIGRQLADIEEFESINGSSLAPEGFDRALRKIRDEAAI